MFPDEAKEKNQLLPFKEFTNPIVLFTSMPPPAKEDALRNLKEMLNVPVGQLSLGSSTPLLETSEAVTAAGEFNYTVPQIWLQAFEAVSSNKQIPASREALLRKVDFFSQTLSLTASEVRRQVTVQEIIERDRSYGTS